MQLEKETMMKKMQRDIYELEKALKRKAEDAACKETEKQIQIEFLAKEKHGSSSDIDSWHKGTRHSPSVCSIVSAFLKTIPNETIYAIHSISVKDYGRGDTPYPSQLSRETMYIATQSKIYRLNLGGDIHGNYRIGPDSIFEKIVTFPSEPTPTFWRAVFSQMGHENLRFNVHGDQTIYLLATDKLEALFRSFR